MRRRNFIKGIAISALVWPLVARAQQSAMAVVGFLRDAKAAGSGFLVDGLRKGLAETGFVEGQNLTIEYAWTEGQSARLSTLATELVRRRVPVIVSSAINATLAAKVATSTIPIVFAVNTDPVALGLVASVNHPGGNLTGVNYLSSELGAKRVGLMHEILPKVTDFGVLVHPTYPTSAPYIRDAEMAARSLGLRIEVLNASNEIEIDSAFAVLSTRKLGGLLVANNTLFTTSRKHIVELTARYAMPTMFVEREFAEDGGLISYGPDLPDSYRQAGVYAGRILKGEKPADLPVLQPTKFQFVINLRAAKALGVKISDNLLSLADEVIE